MTYCGYLSLEVWLETDGNGLRNERINTLYFFVCVYTHTHIIVHIFLSISTFASNYCHLVLLDKYIKCTYFIFVINVHSLREFGEEIGERNGK